MGNKGSSSTKFEAPSYTVQPWKDYLGAAQNQSQQPLTPYGGQTVANMGPMTNQALQMTSDFAMGGSPERTASGQAIVGAAQGEMNPYAALKNPYEGVNPYLNQMIDTSNQKILDTYKRGTEANTNSAYARSGAFGGSAYNDAVGQNQQNLAGALGSNTNALLGQNYNQSAQLAESGLGRAAQGWQQGIGNSLSAAGLGINQQQQDQSAIGQFLQSAQIPEAYQQKLLDAASNYYGQQQQAPYTQLDFLRNALQAASGGQGTTTVTGGGQSGLLGGLGALSLLAGTQG
jgi:hypothetical protein